MAGWAKFTILLCAVYLGTTDLAVAKSMEDKSWYDWLWPLGQRYGVQTLKDEYIPFQGAGQIPDRPRLHIELGDGF